MVLRAHIKSTSSVPRLQQYAVIFVAHYLITFLYQTLKLPNMRLAYVAAASLLSTLSYASPLMTFHERQAPGSYYPITGPTGGVQPRLEIRQLQQTGEMWNLFLLAMEEFELMDQKEIDSYYQIAGQSLSSNT